VQQILSNLLHNAAKYTHRLGHIAVELKLEGDLAAIHIKDDGVGIDAEMLTRVFDLFAQVDRSLDRAQGGLGIGLTLVKNLVGLHGGTVEARSAGVDHGSEFIVRLPTIALTNASRKSKPSPSDSPAPQRRILVVDDNADAALTLKMALEVHGHQVATADDAHEAIATALESKPDFILLDIGLPGMDGYAVATRLRQDEGLHHTIIAAITGYGNDDDRRRSRDSGIDYHLVKPTDVREVTRLLREGRRALA
jgi:CheY-like chemotaxis protein